MTDIRVKICGMRDAHDVANAVDAGATYLGFNFFSKSPRSVSFETARDLAQEVPVGVAKVALVVDFDDDALDRLTGIVPIDLLQLHGTETPARVADIKARTGLPVMKVLGISQAADLAKIDEYAGVADQIMLDAKPPKDAVLPGGNGVTFDWSLLAARKYWTVPWMLAGGLNVGNVAEAISRTGTKQVDVASGVESAPGVKDAAMMGAFVAAAKA